MQDGVTRIHYMDSMRSILMILGVVLHSALIFSPESHWVISSDKGHEFATQLAIFIHVFRMPAFFVISGFFSVILIQKYDVWPFVKLRFRRIVVPLISTALSLNLFQAQILDYTGWKSFDSNEFFFLQGWVSHLWFLNNLIIYFLLTAVVAQFLNIFISKLIKTKLINLINLVLFSPLLFLIMAPVFSIGILTLNKVGFPLYSSFLGVFNTYFIMLYIPYFVFGLILGINKEWLERFSSINILTLMIILVLVNVSKNFTGNFSGSMQEILIVYLDSLMEWISVAMIFYLFKWLFNRPSEKWLFLSNASYSIYLFHHLFVIAFGLVLISFQIPALLALLILIVMTSLVTVLIHKYIVARFKVMSFLFNGK